VVKSQKEILISHHNPEYNFLKNYNLKELRMENLKINLKSLRLYILTNQVSRKAD